MTLQVPKATLASALVPTNIVQHYSWEEHSVFGGERGLRVLRCYFNVCGDGQFRQTIIEILAGLNQLSYWKPYKMAPRE